MQHDKAPILEVVGAALLRNDLCFAARRSAHMHPAHKWEFPGGKIDPGESPQQALRRELEEELGMNVKVGALLGEGFGTTHKGRHLRLRVYLVHCDDTEPILTEHDQAGWFDAQALRALDWAAPDIPILPALYQVMENIGSGFAGDN